MPRYGAVDIGSNSIRMQVAELLPGQPPRILAQDREVTRLGESVFRHGEVSVEAMDQTCRVLARMAATLRTRNVLAVRAVATSAIRDCRNQDEFLQRAQQALGGIPPEIISGQEEARLIHLGVQSRWPQPDEDIVIVDIGGGSAEVIRSRKGNLAEAFSKPLGAVRLTELFLRHDPPTPAELHQFRDYVREKTVVIRSELGGLGAGKTIATAATAAAVMRAIHGISSAQKDAVDRVRTRTDQVLSLFEELAALNLRRRRIYPGIGSKRAEIIIAGCGALALILEALEAREVHYSAAGVRDGIIADLAQRGEALRHARLDADQRRSVRRMARRCGVSLRHAERVAELAGQLFDGLESLHQLEPHWGALLEAAAYLHDIGHFVSDTRHHRHSYYLVANSDLAGFTNQERGFIANLCRYHRKNLPRPSQENYKALSAAEKKALMPLIPLLRLADSLDRGHEQRITSVQTDITPKEVRLLLKPDSETELERWAAAQHAPVFEQIFGVRLAIDHK